MFEKIMVIAGGGALGSLARFGLSSWVEAAFANRYFPAGIFACNVLGSFVVGIIAGLIINKSDFNMLWRLFLVIGFCGGFTTFSSFSLDTVTLLRTGAVGLAFINIILSVAACLMATYVGLILIPKG